MTSGEPFCLFAFSGGPILIHLVRLERNAMAYEWLIRGVMALPHSPAVLNLHVSDSATIVSAEESPCSRRLRLVSKRSHWGEISIFVSSFSRSLSF